MKMKCDRTKRLLSAYADGELPVKIREEVERHLLLCPGCRRELQALQDVKGFLSQAPVPELPPYLFSRTVARVRAQAVRPEGVRVLVWRLALGLVVAVSLGLGVLLGAGLASGNGTSEEVAALNAEPSVEEIFAGGW